MKILVASYSQSGQLNEIVSNFLSVFERDEIDKVDYIPEKQFPFPWTSVSFFDVMPESVMEKKVVLRPIHFKYKVYDLVIFAYQPWYLSPSIPANSILQDPLFLSHLKGVPVVTLIGARNMWINAQKSVVKRITAAGGLLVGNVPFIDRHHNIVSAFTILHWMLTGNKTRKFNFFPFPGVSEADIDGASVYGELVKQAAQKSTYDQLQGKIVEKGNVTIATDVFFIEERAKRLFVIWAKIIMKLGSSPKRRRMWLLVYKYYLITALFIIAPIVLFVYKIFVLPFVKRKVDKRKSYICSKNLMYL